MTCDPSRARSDTHSPLVPTTEARLETGDGWPEIASRPHLYTRPRRALRVSRQQGMRSTHVVTIVITVSRSGRPQDVVRVGPMGGVPGRSRRGGGRPPPA